MILQIALVLLLNEETDLDRVRLAVAGVAGVEWQAAAPSARAEKRLEDYKALVENNIFSPPKPPRKVEPPKREEKREEKKPDPPKPPDPILVTGFYLAEATQAYEAVIEDKKKKEIRFCKPGDSADRWTIVSVAHDKMVVKDGDGKEFEFRVGDVLNGAPPPISEKAMLGESDLDPAKVEEARKRRREQLGKKGMVEDEEEDPKVEKRNKKDK